MKLAIFGANGQTGRLATALALDAGHEVLAVTRRPREFPLAGPGLTVAEADVRALAGAHTQRADRGARAQGADRTTTNWLAAPVR